MDAVVIGKFVIARYPDGGIWIQHNEGDRAGEGGQFDEAALEAVIAKFYAEHF